MMQRTKSPSGAFLRNPQRICRYFIAANLLPCLALACTEPYDLLGKTLLLTFPLGMYMAVYALLKNVGLLQLLLIPLLILNSFQIVLSYLFRDSVIAADMFLNLATTSASEAGELLDSLWPPVVAVCVIYLPAIAVAAVACKRKLRLAPAFRKRTALRGGLIALISWGLTFAAGNPDTGSYRLQDDVFPVNVCRNLCFAARKWHKSRNYPITSRGFRFDAVKTDIAGGREIYVLVIGEAGRAHNWSLWGYGRETNPLLARTEGLVLYRDALTQANATHKSVPLILSAASAGHFDLIYRQKSVITAFREAGFTTVFLSNQIPNRSFTDYFAAEADYCKNIRPASGGGLLTGNSYDAALLPLLRRCIDSLPGNLFAVLHTYGSHFNYTERYPRSFARFLPDEVTEIKSAKRQLVNAYDNSIRYTDYFLHRLIGLLDSAACCSALYYCSDHGEDLLDDGRRRFLHSSPHPTYYQLHIPLFLWFSEPYRQRFPRRCAAALDNSGRPVSTRSAFHTLLDLASIRTPLLDSAFSLVSPACESRRRMYLTDRDLPVPWFRSGIKKQDKAMAAEKRLDCR